MIFPRQPANQAQPTWLESLKKAPVTYSVMGACIVGHMITRTSHPELFYHGAMQVQKVMQGEVWRIVTGPLLHASDLHLGLNMLSLYKKRNVESKVGSIKVVAAAVAALAFTLFAKIALTNWHLYSVGISGVCFALRGMEVGSSGGSIQEIANRCAKFVCDHSFEILGYVALSALGMKIDHLAHVTGFFAGVVVGSCTLPRFA